MSRRQRDHIRLAATLLAASLLAAACGSEGGGISGEAAARITIDPVDRDVRVLAGNVAIGESSVYDLTIRNTGEADLLIEDVALSYAPPAGVEEPSPAFALELPFGVDPADGAIRVRPSGRSGPGRDELTLSVLFRHHDRSPRTARLTIVSNSREDEELTVVFTTEEGRPVVQPDPTEIVFGSVSSGAAAELPLTILNNGNADLFFEGFQLIGDTGFTFVDPVRGAEWPLEKETEDGVVFTRPHIVTPNSSLEVLIRFTPQSPRTHEARLVLFTNDTSVDAGDPVRIVANRELPRVSVTPEEIDFGTVPIGATRPRTVQVAATGNAPLEIVSIAFDDETSDDFEIDLTGLEGFEDGSTPTVANPIVVPVGDAVSFPVTFTPDMEVRDPDGVLVADVGAVHVRTNAYEPERAVALVGTGAVSTCPIADVRVVEGEEVVPQTVLHLRGDASFSSCGEIVRWEWSVTQPDGSASSFLPSRTFVNPSFTANVAGAYRFCLTVRDTCGLDACAPACADVVVVPDEALHIELLWETPGDPDEFDEGPLKGSDLDLHFAHPFALIGGEDLDGDQRPDGWFNQTYDCFWANKHPDWGSFSPDADDDPGLDRDDTDGAGPENVNLDNPEDLTAIPPEFIERLGGEPAAYRVGVHYWDDHGFGPALATLRVYVHGTPVYEKSGVELQPLDMWSALTIDWPSGVVTELRTPDGALRIAPDYEHPAFIAP